MPTSSEQKALAFIAIVVLLGGAVRVLRAGSAPSTADEQQALARQSSSVDSVARTSRGKKSPKRRTSASRSDTLPHVVAGVASVPPTYARPGQPFSHSPFGYPPPSPRIVVDQLGAHAVDEQEAPRKGRNAKPMGVIDIEAASANEIEQLPKIGPALAKRIVANRDSLGRFGSITGLKRVKGVSKATLDAIAPFISFGGRRPELPINH
ncbi:MAG: helix-hairpin-helix domain-containing protein [Gemmatimonadota bacterium]